MHLVPPLFCVELPESELQWIVSDAALVLIPSSSQYEALGSIRSIRANDTSVPQISGRFACAAFPSKTLFSDALLKTRDLFLVIVLIFEASDRLFTRVGQDRVQGHSLIHPSPSLSHTKIDADGTI